MAFCLSPQIDIAPRMSPRRVENFPMVNKTLAKVPEGMLEKIWAKTTGNLPPAWCRIYQSACGSSSLCHQLSKNIVQGWDTEFLTMSMISLPFLFYYDEGLGAGVPGYSAGKLVWGHIWTVLIGSGELLTVELRSGSGYKTEIGSDCTHLLSLVLDARKNFTFLSLG